MPERRPLRIAVAVRDARSLSGTTTVARELAAGAAKAGHVVRILSHKPPRTNGSGVPTGRVPMLPFPSMLRAWSFDLAARMAARAFEADLVHGHGDLTAQDVLTVNNVDAAEAHHTGRSRVGSSGTLFIRARQFAAARRIVAVSRQAKRDLGKFYGVEEARVSVIPLGVDAGRFTPRGREADRASIRASLGLPAASRLTLTLLSGDAERRNVKGLVLAYSRAKLPSESVLLVVGDADASGYPGARELLAAGRLKLLPKSSEPERLYRAADAFVLAAHYETFGMTVLEAMACGVPVALTASCGVSELVQDGENALVVADSRDAAALERAIERLAEPGAAARLAEGGSRLAAERPWSRTVAEYLALYDELASEKAGARA